MYFINLKMTNTSCFLRVWIGRCRDNSLMNSEKKRLTPEWKSRIDHSKENPLEQQLPGTPCVTPCPVWKLWSFISCYQNKAAINKQLHACCFINLCNMFSEKYKGVESQNRSCMGFALNNQLFFIVALLVYTPFPTALLIHDNIHSALNSKHWVTTVAENQ